MKPDYLEMDKGYKTLCWHWQKAVEKKGRSKGYPKKSVKGRMKRAHRHYYEKERGVTLKREEHLDHLCKNRACVNPDHLEIVTALENHHRRARIDQVIADEIRSIYPTVKSQRKVAAQFGLSRRYVVEILNGEVWNGS